MRFRELRHVLQSLVLAGLPACSGVDVETIDNGCSHEQHADFDFEPSAGDLPLQLRVESCRVDADACTQLCTLLMNRAGLGGPDTCLVTFEGESVKASASRSWSEDCPGVGRRPAGLVAPRSNDAHTAVGAWLAQAAWLEAASIPAFVYLARELDQLGAPRGLARAAIAAVRDEIRHAKLMRRLAARYGAAPPAVEVAPPTERSLEAIAIENAAEGCVRETWGAVQALWSARRAHDPELRAAFAAIAIDESRHATLAWAVDAWASTRLDRAALARVADARATAVRELFDHDVPDTLAVLGLPSGAEGRALLGRASAVLWTRGVS